MGKNNAAVVPKKTTCFACKKVIEKPPHQQASYLKTHVKKHKKSTAWYCKIEHCRRQKFQNKCTKTSPVWRDEDRELHITEAQHLKNIQPKVEASKICQYCEKKFKHPGDRSTHEKLRICKCTFFIYKPFIILKKIVLE